GVVGGIEPAHRVDHPLRLLSGGRAVQVHQRLAVNCLPKDWEIRSGPLRVEPRSACGLLGPCADHPHATSATRLPPGSLAATSCCTRALRSCSLIRRTISLANA